jgi:hypothetical protein
MAGVKQRLRAVASACIFFALRSSLCSSVLTPRNSGANTTKGFRKAISSHYASSDCQYIAVKHTVQEHMEIEEIYSGKSEGQVMAFQDLWRYKGRLVRGQDKTL